MAKRVVVVGGGVAGLATALALRDGAAATGRDVEVSVVEAAPRLGGNLRSERADGFVVEWGPNGFLDNAPATLDLVDRLGLAGELQPADRAAALRKIREAMMTANAAIALETTPQEPDPRCC